MDEALVKKHLENLQKTQKKEENYQKLLEEKVRKSDEVREN
jgi:hypothetical protein